MAKMKSSQLIMLDHSKAKVELYRRYLSIYLNVISRVPFIKKIYLYDLFAGEGEYLNGEKGSSVITMECIKNHFFSNNQTSPNIDVHLNDSEKSEIEIGINKIDRVKKFVSEIFKPSNVSIEFSKKEYNDLIQRIITKLDGLKDFERALLFIDPWGYKEINPKELKEIVRNGKTEILLFLPISFMYRFADKALSDENFFGGKPLEKFLSELFGGELPDTKNQLIFINEVKVRFKKYLKINYVDTFTIERGNKNFFSLFFFTNNKTGYYKMLDAKWDLDEESGRGFKISNSLQPSFFDEVTAVDYSSMILDFLKSKTIVTNQDLFDFGLDCGFLPKHTKKALDELKSKEKIFPISLDNLPVKGYYIDDNHSRKIQIKIK
ncbi:MAG: three-Cys-motif partner protein TcmP [Bacteroidota bacterium]|nr:three-Cys-motif partner protein TcmP [Bacteroidota bacterium]